MGTTLLSQHDDTDKTFSTAFQQTVIDGKNTTAGMLEEIETDIIAPLALTFATNNYFWERRKWRCHRYQCGPQ